MPNLSSKKTYDPNDLLTDEELANFLDHGLGGGVLREPPGDHAVADLPAGGDLPQAA